MPPFASSFHLYALVAIVFWSTSYVFTKLIADAFSPLPLAFLRVLIAAVVMALILLRRKTPRPANRELLRFALPGFLGISLYYTLFNKATSLTNPTTVVIAIATASVFTPVLARFIDGEHLRIAGWLAIFFAFAGILIMTLWEGTVQLNTGVLWCVAAAISLAFFNLLQRRLAKSYSPLQINAYCFLTALIPMFAFAPEAMGEIAAAAGWKILIVLYMGIFPSALAYLAWVKALASSPKASYTTNYMFLTPLFTAVLEFSLMGQFPDAPTIVGGAVILLSLALFAFAGKKA